MAKWTLEARDNGCRIARGGHYDGKTSLIGSRGRTLVSQSQDKLGSRISLYIK